MTRLLLVRHAPVDTGPPPGRLCGFLDLPLSRDGRAQLQALLQRPDRGVRPDALYTSTLVRAREVARALGARWRLPVRSEPLLREIHCGALEGRRIADIEAADPQLWASNQAQIDDAFTWPGGESYQAFRARILRGFGGIAARHVGRQVAAVTHAGVIAQVLGVIRGRPAAVWELDRPAPLTATEITWVNGAPDAVLSFNRDDWL